MSTIPSLAEQFYQAAWNGDLNLIQSLLENNENVPAQVLLSALESAAYNAQPDACELLLKQGVDPNAFSEFSAPTQETVLHQVITKTSKGAERTRIVKLLIAHGAEVNCRTLPNIPTLCFMRDIRTRGESPLHRAAAYGDVEMIAALIEAGADKSVRDSQGESPLTWASWHLRDTEVLKLLLYGEFEGSL